MGTVSRFSQYEVHSSLLCFQKSPFRYSTKLQKIKGGRSVSCKLHPSRLRASKIHLLVVPMNMEQYSDWRFSLPWTQYQEKSQPGPPGNAAPLVPIWNSIHSSPSLGSFLKENVLHCTSQLTLIYSYFMKQAVWLQVCSNTMVLYTSTSCLLWAQNFNCHWAPQLL